VANIRNTDGVDDTIVLGGGGGAVALAGYTLLWIGRATTLTSGGSALISMQHAPASTHAVIYMVNANWKIGSGPGDVDSSMTIPNTTDVFLLAVKKTGGAAAPSFYQRNLTTGAAASTAIPGTTIGDLSSTWDKSELGNADGGAFPGLARHGVGAAWHNSQMSTAQLNTITNATSQIAALSPTKLWDFNQSSTAIDVNNVTTGLDDQSSITGTNVVNDAAFDFWTFGLSVAGPPPNQLKRWRY
jgi:hypothetical protein